ncbi:MAG TPA: hypothetical protein VEW95_09305 [Candidatus Limnocylindrales bacterium]|nr:hypothetical protein [Candidatus Limnocylindrales bacterium]
MTTELRQLYVEALIASVSVSPSIELFDRIERLPAARPPADRSMAGQSGARAPVSGPVDPSAAAFPRCRYCQRAFKRIPTVHERWCLQNPDRERWDPQPVNLGGGAPPDHVDSYLCERCQEPFPTRQALAEHRRSHPPIPVVPEPMPRASQTLPTAVSRLG